VNLRSQQIFTGYLRRMVETGEFDDGMKYAELSFEIVAMNLHQHGVLRSGRDMHWTYELRGYLHGESDLSGNMCKRIDSCNFTTATAKEGPSP
jgi:hypothetical protein